ncbi:MAG: (d)CMP kinase [Bacilli bacterium]|nr:(d)CMP kinase [Bacilli bacterium]
MNNLFQIIDELVHSKERVIIAIDGPCASGKSTLGKILEERYSALLFHTDDYFLHPSRKTKERLNESGGNVDYERLYSEIFSHINQELIPSNHFNCSTNLLEYRLPVPNKKVVIVEGTYSMHQTLFKHYTYRIFLEIDSKSQIERIRKRNGEKMLDKFIKEWIPLENFYFKSEDLKERADYILKLDI